VLEKVTMEMNAAGAAYLEESRPVCPEATMPMSRGSRQSRNRFGAVVTEVAYEQMLRDVESKKLEEANSKSSAEEKTAAAWEKQRPGIRAAEAQLQGVSTPTKLGALKVHELKSLIFGRTGHLPKAKNNKDRAMELEAARHIRAPLLLPATPIAPPGDGRMDESLEEESADPRTELSYTEEPPSAAAAATPPVAPEPEQAATVTTTTTTTRAAAAAAAAPSTATATSFLDSILAADESAPPRVALTAAEVR
jgi:hypothetical protein